MAGFFSRLFGGGGRAGPAPLPSEEHAGYTITPEPIEEGRVFRVAALIEKNGRSHRLIRADTLNDRDAAAAASVAKARQVIDEQGERLFS